MACGWGVVRSNAATVVGEGRRLLFPLCLSVPLSLFTIQEQRIGHRESGMRETFLADTESLGDGQRGWPVGCKLGVAVDKAVAAGELPVSCGLPGIPRGLTRCMIAAEERGNGCGRALVFSGVADWRVAGLRDSERCTAVTAVAASGAYW